MKKLLNLLLLLVLVFSVGCEVVSSSTSLTDSSSSSISEVNQDEVLIQVNQVIEKFVQNYASTYINETNVDYVFVAILAHLGVIDQYLNEQQLENLASKEKLEAITGVGNAFKFSVILSALNKDISTYNEVNLGDKLVDINAVGNYQSLYGLMAMNNYKHELSQSQSEYVNRVINDMLEASSPKNATVDTGGTTLIALAPYYNSNVQVKAVVDEYVSWIALEEQTIKGEVKDAWMGENAATIAQVIMGLVANNLDPRGVDFTKAEGDLITALLTYATNDGSFKYQLTDETSDLMFSSPQAILSLVVYKLFKEKNQAVNAFMFN